MRLPVVQAVLPELLPDVAHHHPWHGKKGLRVPNLHKPQKATNSSSKRLCSNPRGPTHGLPHVAAGGKCVLQKRGLIGDGIFGDAAREGSQAEITPDYPGGPKYNDKRQARTWREERLRADRGRDWGMRPQPRDSGRTLRLDEAGGTLPRASSRSAALSPPGCGPLAARRGENNAWCFKVLVCSVLFYSSCRKTNPGAG